MPELPEVETVRRGLAPVLEGRRLARAVARRADLRWPLPDGFGQHLTGRRVERVERRAKFLLFRLDNGWTLIGHLGMSGRFRVHLADQPWPAMEPHDHVIFATDDGAEVRFNDPRRFGFFDLVETARTSEHPMLARLGPEPLSAGFDGPTLALALKGRRTPIKAALLDQKVVAGVGNIYACEALFEAGISPRRLAAGVQGGRAERLAAAIKRVLAAAIEAGGSSLRDHRRTDGELGYFQHAFKVYGRTGERCPGCDCAPGIRHLVQAGRSSFYCPRRQR